MDLSTIVKISAHTDNLDEALSPIQEALGVTEGEYASLWWSGNKEKWTAGNFEKRGEMLAEYIADELRLVFHWEGFADELRHWSEPEQDEDHPCAWEAYHGEEPCCYCGE